MGETRQQLLGKELIFSKETDLFVNTYIPMENVTLKTFNSYQEYYAFVYEQLSLPG